MSTDPRDSEQRSRARLMRWRTHLERIAIGIASCLVCGSLLMAITHMPTYDSTLVNHGGNASDQNLETAVANPLLREHMDGYHPVGEVSVPNKRMQDHVVLLSKTGAANKYVCWTTGSALKTSLTIPAAHIDTHYGTNVTVPITLRHKPRVLWGTPYIDEHNTVNAVAAGLVTNGIRSNTTRLNIILRLLPTQVLKRIFFPSGHYAFTGVVNMVSNITMLGEQGKTFIQMPRQSHGGIVIWYPTGGAAGYDGMHDVTWENITFRGNYRNLMPTQTIYQPLIHANTITYDSCTFIMVQRSFGHLLDVDGSTNITVRNSTVVGSPNRGQTFKEAFQMDVAALGASGYYDKQTVFNNLPTTHMSIVHNRFLPLRSSTGRVLLPAAAPFGTHMAYAKTTKLSSYVRFGLFAHNYVEDPAAYEGAGAYNSAVIHFDAADDITIADNTFNWTGATPQPSWAVAFYARSHRMVKPAGWHGITITGNTFKGFAPKKGVFELYRDRDSIDVPGRSVSVVTIRKNRFEATPLAIALTWLHNYSRSFIVTHDHIIMGSDNVVDGIIYLDAHSSTTRNRNNI